MACTTATATATSTASAVADADKVTSDWLGALFPDKDAAKLQAWVSILSDEELCTVGDLRALNPDDWQQLGLPLAVRRKIQSHIAPPPAPAAAQADGGASSSTATSALSAADLLLAPGRVDDRMITQIDCIVMDVSYSMKSRSSIDRDKTREDISKIFFLNFVDKLIGLEMPHAVSLISFGKEVIRIGDFTRDYDKFQDEMGRLDANESSTMLYDAVLRAAEIIQAFEADHKSALADGYSKRIFVLTDGEDNCSKSAAWEVAHTLQCKNIIMDAIPVGGPNTTLQALACASGGLALTITSEAQGMEMFENDALLATVRREKVDASPPRVQCAADLNALLSTVAKEELVSQVVAVAPKAAGPSVSIGDAVKGIETSNAPLGASTRRILKELSDLSKDPPAFFSFSVSEQDTHKWQASIVGRKGTLYEGGVFLLDITLPADYPFKPPKVVFITKMFHPNINSNGAICLDVLKASWSPALTIAKIVMSIESLLYCPNPDDPLDSFRAQMYLQERERYNRECREWVVRYACP